MEKEEAWSPDDPVWSARPDVVFVREFLAPRFSGAKVLDLGAGSGRWVHLWAEHGVDLVSAEWSPPFLERLIKRSREFGARAEQLDIIEHALPETFDLVFATMFLIHLHPDHIRAAMRNIDRMAARHLCFTTWRDPEAFDDSSTSKVQSFSHDFPSLFSEIGWRPVLNVGVTYNDQTDDTRNRLWFLEKESPVSP